VGKGNIIPEKCISPPSSLYKLRFNSVEILLFDVLAVQKFSSKCNVVMFRVQNGLVCCLEMKYEKSLWIQTDGDKYYDSATEDEEPRPPCDSISLHSLQVQIISPAALKMRSMLAM
jgi:hypothetical protein